MKIFVFFREITELRRVSQNKDNWPFKSKFLFAVLEEWIFENFRGPFHDELIRYKFLNAYLNKM